MLNILKKSMRKYGENNCWDGEREIPGVIMLQHVIFWNVRKRLVILPLHGF